MKDAYYFSHDSNARNDPKCSALIAEHGIAAYGIYWVIIELMSEQAGYRLEKFPKLYEAIAKQCSSELEATRSTIEALINDYNLLNEDEKYIWSNSLIRRMQEREKKRQAKIEAGRQGGLKSGLTRRIAKQNEALVEAEQSELEANEPKERKGKESKDIDAQSLFEADIRSPFKSKMQQERFDAFWRAYPLKKSKGNAEKAWMKINPGQELFSSIMNSLMEARKSAEWKKDNGRYIPYPATWLNAKGWEDEFRTEEVTINSIRGTGRDSRVV